MQLPLLLAFSFLVSPTNQQGGSATWGFSVDYGTFEGSQTSAGDGLGQSVSVNGDLALAGSLDSGAYVFRREEESLVEEAWLTSAQVQPGDQFGWAVELLGDVAVVSAPAKSGGGTVLVFERDQGTWIEVAELVASDASEGDEFGRSLALDGELLMVGAPGRSAGTGAAYLFERSAGVWSQVALFEATDGTPGDRFGDAVAVRIRTALVGAPHDDEQGPDAGSAYLFKSDGAAWSPFLKITPDQPQAGERFASDVDLGPDTDSLPSFTPDIVVGSPGWNGSGRALVFLVFGEMAFQEQQILPQNPETGMEYGASIDLMELQSLLAIGAPGDRPTQGAGGSVELLWQTDTPGYGILTTIQAPNSQPGDRYGQGSAIWSDFFVAGAPGSNDFGDDHGAAAYQRIIPRPFLTYCSSLPNSTGAEALASVLIEPGGTPQQPFRLVAGFLPEDFGVFFLGPDSVDLPFGNGIRCVGGSGIVRFPPALAQGGILEVEADINQPPLLGNLPLGGQWHVQAWFRDQAAGGSSFNLSSAFILFF